MGNFKYYLTLAARNLWRQRRRTILTFLAVSLGLASFLVADSLMKGLDKQSIDNLITLETGELRLTAPGYIDIKEEDPLKKLLPKDQKLLALLAEDSEIAGLAPRLSFPVRVGNGWDEYPQEAVGIDPVKDTEVFKVKDYLVEGRWPEAGYEVLISRDTAKILELGIGDYLLMTTRTKSGAFQAVDMEIVGIVNTVNPNTNNQVFLPLAAAQEIVGVPDFLSQVDLRLAAGVDAREKAASLKEKIAGAGFQVETQPWQEMAEEFLQISKTKNAFIGIFLMMILLIATVGIVNSILLATIERTREIGVLKAMGMTEGNIVRLFLVEAALIGLLGSGAGLAIALAGEYYMVNVGLDMTEIIGNLDVGYPITGLIKGAWNPGTMVGGFFFCLLVCVLAGILPARYGAKKEPIEALRRV
ncbi:MAG: ABC transporter permease [Firmicutes bacterium]|nr:ABC transporter permease [Bacillota bacterium]